MNLVSAPQELVPVMKIMYLSPTELLKALELSLFLRIFLSLPATNVWQIQKILKQQLHSETFRLIPRTFILR